MAEAAGQGLKDLQEEVEEGRLGGEWVLDKTRSAVRLRSKSMWGLAPVRGNFNEMEGRPSPAPCRSVSA